MDEYDMMYKATEAHNGRPESYRIAPQSWRSANRQWDSIVCTVCTGCGRPLGKHENLKRLAFCLECRKILFPETVSPKESLRKRPFYRRTMGNFW